MTGSLKLILDRDMRVLGARVVGPNAANLVQPFVFMMNWVSLQRIESLEVLASGARLAASYYPCPEAGTVRPALNQWRK